MNVPALAAREPSGPTQTITGSGALSSEVTMSRVAVEVAARRVELDQSRRRTFTLRLGHAVADVAGHELVDDARCRHHVDLGGTVLRLRGCRQHQCQPGGNGKANCLLDQIGRARTVHWSVIINQRCSALRKSNRRALQVSRRSTTSPTSPAARSCPRASPSRELRPADPSHRR